jgi:putative transposase
MREWQSLSHVRWYCRYHVVFVPKYRKRAIFGHLRRQIGGILRELCVQHEIELVEGHAMPDHVHLLLSIPPKFSVANTVGFVKGKSAIRIHRQFLGVERNFRGFHFWARGYCVSTVGLDEDKIRKYIREQEDEERRQEQLPFGGLQPPARAPGGRPGA